MAHVDYYFALVSPFTYLAGARLERIADQHGATVTYKPLDLMALFAQTGGPAPFAFARLADPEVPPGRRFALTLSAAVFALTKLRSREEGEEGGVRPPVFSAAQDERATIPTSTVVVCAFALLALVAVLTLVVFG